MTIETKVCSIEGAELTEWLEQNGLSDNPLNPMLNSATFVVLPSMTVVCEILTMEDHSVVSRSRPINKADYNRDKGMLSAFVNARNLLWDAVAYRARLENRPTIVRELKVLYKG